MSRDLSQNTLQALFAPETGEAFLVLLTLDHDDLDVPIRVTSDAVETTSQGRVFVPYPFELIIPDERENQSPRARLRLDNISREIVAAIRSIATSPAVLMEVVRAADPDVIETSFPDFRFINVSYDALTVEGDLSIEDFTAEPYPARVFSPGDFPGLF